MGFEDGPAEPYATEYEGVVNMVRRYFNDTSSDYVRNWAEGFMQLSSCPECNGTRLKKESLMFKVDGRNIAELGNLNLANLAEWFKDVEKD